ncbi:hypothetical protein KCMC57_up63020 [Kitasatospora sp. CMC57]|uniref:Bulb-type lectin domain-containing protein n=1 Tax=Kitasatospora sp. CMC57 TaxID=3231513 RepID=A0AB33KAV3_9ACTN
MGISQLSGTWLRKAVVRTAVVCTAAITVITTSGTEAMALPAGNTAANFTLPQPDWHAGDYAGNPDWTAWLTFQSDGNLVLYSRPDQREDQPLWASGTNGMGVTRIIWSQSGYVKLINSSGGIVCTVGALSPAPGGVARLQSDGNFVFYDTNGSSTWASGTSGLAAGNRNYCNT